MYIDDERRNAVGRGQKTTSVETLSDMGGGKPTAKKWKCRDINNLKRAKEKRWQGV